MKKKLMISVALLAVLGAAVVGYSAPTSTAHPSKVLPSC